jgi:hypothetical protein
MPSVLYRYPQAPSRTTTSSPRTPLAGLGRRTSRTHRHRVLEDSRFFDVLVTHAKAGPDDVLHRDHATNHGPDPAPLHLLPQLWFRNTWSWGRDDRVPRLRLARGPKDESAIIAEHGYLGRYLLVADAEPRILFCDNETNQQATFGVPGGSKHPKDAINAAVVHGDASMVRRGHGTKAAFWWHWDAVAPGESVTIRLRLIRDGDVRTIDPFADFDAIRDARHGEADAFYAAVIPADVPPEDAFIARRAFAGLQWCKQIYRYDVRQWLDGDPAEPAPPRERLARQPLGRNTSWRHLSLADVISMPDEWEYPWFAAWDLAFHCVALAHVDPDFAKEQLVLMCREWAMHPNGQLPAYEWNFSDVNPPVHAWAAWQVYTIDGSRDQEFLTRVFTKLLFNFGWWVNRKDADGSNLFEGGFLGMDNIGPFDRSAPLPDGARAWSSPTPRAGWRSTACSCCGSLGSWHAPSRPGTRSRRNSSSTSSRSPRRWTSSAPTMSSSGIEEDGFYYDVVVAADGSSQKVRLRSMVGLLPLIGVANMPAWVDATLPDFTGHRAWLQARRPELLDALVHLADGSPDTLSVLTPDRLVRLLRRLVDESEFLAPGGIRSMSAAYREGTTLQLEGADLPVRYVPGASDSRLFGGNSNWRGPIWFPVNVLLTDALRRYAGGMAADVQVEYPAGSGRLIGVAEVADDIDRRLVGLFRIGPDGRRPSDPRDIPTHPLWQAHPTFSEYFHGDTGAGLGATHQTGWTALVAHLVCLRED